jgi:predicted AAA+ superfamily ATPase
VLRGLIDQMRQQGHKVGHFLLLGSASGKLLAQSSESLAGRVTHVEMSALLLEEVGAAEPMGAIDKLWLRGGFPESYGAASFDLSFTWRLDFIRSYLEHDVGMFAPRVASTTLRRLWAMLANDQGGLLNASRLAESLMVSGASITRYIDLLADLFLVRRLPPYHVETTKRLVRSPKIYLRDSGLTHALLNLHRLDDLLQHSAVGGSWESFVMEQLIAAAPLHTAPYFYRTARGAGIDLLLEIPKHGLWVFEIKRSRAPSLKRGFYTACEDLAPARRMLVYSGDTTYAIKPETEVMPIWAAVQALRALK